jgi:hypothetical protein
MNLNVYFQLEFDKRSTSYIYQILNSLTVVTIMRKMRIFIRTSFLLNQQQTMCMILDTLSINSNLTGSREAPHVHGWVRVINDVQSSCVYGVEIEKPV